MPTTEVAPIWPPVGTFASILEVEPYEDGRSDLLTVGSRRFRLLGVEPIGKPYLQARVDWLPEEHGTGFGRAGRRRPHPLRPLPGRARRTRRPRPARR